MGLLQHQLFKGCFRLVTLITAPQRSQASTRIAGNTSKENHALQGPIKVPQFSKRTAAHTLGCPPVNAPKQLHAVDARALPTAPQLLLDSGGDPDTVISAAPCIAKEREAGPGRHTQPPALHPTWPCKPPSCERKPHRGQRRGRGAAPGHPSFLLSR